jgi:hypothetical protein
MGAVVRFAGFDSRSVSYDHRQPLKWELKMSVNGASMIFVYCIYFAVENTPWMLDVLRLSTVIRAFTAFWPYYSHCNGELKVGVTSALHFFSEYLFGDWK